MAIFFKTAKPTICHLRKYYYCVIQKENQDREEAKLAKIKQSLWQKKNLHPSLPSAAYRPN